MLASSCAPTELVLLLANMTPTDVEYLDKILEDDMASEFVKKKCRMLLYAREVACAGGVKWKQKTRFFVELKRRSGLGLRAAWNCLESYHQGGIRQALMDGRVDFTGLELSEDQTARLKKIADNPHGLHNKHEVVRARALLAAGHVIGDRVPYVNQDITAKTGRVSTRTLVDAIHKFRKHGMDAVFMRKKHPVDKRAKSLRAFLKSAIASVPPKGYCGWTLDLLAQEAVKRGFSENGSLTRERVRQILGDYDINIKSFYAGWRNRMEGRIYSGISKINEMPKCESDMIRRSKFKNENTERARTVFLSALLAGSNGASPDDCVALFLELISKLKINRFFAMKRLADHIKYGTIYALFGKHRARYEDIELTDADRRMLDGILDNKKGYLWWIVKRAAVLVALDKNTKAGVVTESIRALAKELKVTPKGIRNTVDRYRRIGIRCIEGWR